MAVRAMKNRELQEVANIRSATDRLEDVTDAEERAKFEKECRSRELQEIAALRKPKWEEVVSSANGGQNRTGIVELEEARSNIRGAASAWQEREKQKTEGMGKQPPAVPTRRIGNLFSHNSSQWRMETEEQEEEPFPEPPSQEEVNNNQLFEEYLNDCFSSEEHQARSGTPAPPPRDSSKDYMMEYQHTATTSVDQTWSNNN